MSTVVGCTLNGFTTGWQEFLNRHVVRIRQIEPAVKAAKARVQQLQVDSCFLNQVPATQFKENNLHYFRWIQRKALQASCSEMVLCWSVLLLLHPEDLKASRKVDDIYKNKQNACFLFKCTVKRLKLWWSWCGYLGVQKKDRKSTAGLKVTKLTQRWTNCQPHMDKLGREGQERRSQEFCNDNFILCGQKNGKKGAYGVPHSSCPSSSSSWKSARWWGWRGQGRPRSGMQCSDGVEVQDEVGGGGGSGGSGQSANVKFLKASNQGVNVQHGLFSLVR